MGRDEELSDQKKKRPELLHCPGSDLEQNVSQQEGCS